MEREKVVRGNYNGVIPGGELSGGFKRGGVRGQKVFDVHWITCLECWNVEILEWMYEIDE